MMESEEIKIDQTDASLADEPTVESSDFGIETTGIHHSRSKSDHQISPSKVPPIASMSSAQTPAQKPVLANPLESNLDNSYWNDSNMSEDEGIQDYKIGGYHPVHVGEIVGNRYIILQKLGWGHFSTVWLSKDIKHNSFVALKFQKSADHYIEAAYDEVKILN